MYDDDGDVDDDDERQRKKAMLLASSKEVYWTLRIDYTKKMEIPLMVSRPQQKLLFLLLLLLLFLQSSPSFMCEYNFKLLHPTFKMLKHTVSRSVLIKSPR